MVFEENAVLFGHDPEPGIVAAEFDGTDEIALYLRGCDGVTTRRTEKFRPFLWAAAEGGEAVESADLAGDLTFRKLLWFESWAAFIKAKAALKAAGRSNFSLSDPAQQYLLATGKTLFKGMEWPELRRMQIAADSKSIHLADSSGWAETLDRSELEKLSALIRERDPDVIEGHDLFKKTLPGIAAHARNAKVKLLW